MNIQNPPILKSKIPHLKFPHIFCNIPHFRNIFPRFEIFPHFSKCPYLYYSPFFKKFSSPLLYPIFSTLLPHFYQYSPSHLKMEDFAKNFGDFNHGGFWILKFGILNFHQMLPFSHKTYISWIGIFLLFQPSFCKNRRSLKRYSLKDYNEGFLFNKF